MPLGLDRGDGQLEASRQANRRVAIRRLLSRFTAAWVIASSVGLGCGSDQAEAPPPPEVVVTPVVQKDVPLYAYWIGTTEGYNNATIRPQVKGYLLEINYKQGRVMKPGDLLFTIDPREFKAELESAQGQLGEAQANLRKTQTHVKRYRPLAKEGAVSQQELDDAVQNMEAAQASVQSAQARVDQASLNLSWTKITSPIGGVAGISVAQIGDLVSPETSLTTVSQLNPIKVNFPITQQSYLKLVREIGGRSGAGNLANAGPILQLYLADDSEWPEMGTPFVLGRQVDEQTGTILVEGRFPNPKNVLRPGQFARVRARVGEEKNALVVPQRAVTDVQGISMISIVNSDNIVEVKPIEVGTSTKEDWVVTKGLKLGERVIVEGLQKVKSGMKVKPVAASSDTKKPEKQEDQAKKTALLLPDAGDLREARPPRLAVRKMS